jgi:PAS domain S-box-containing protein
MSAMQNRRILLVDDMATIHGDFRKILVPDATGQPDLAAVEAELFGVVDTTARPAFEVDSAYQGQEALAMVQAALREGRPYAMAFVDMRMPPGWDGVETIEHLWKVDEQLQVVICTAYSDHSWESVLARLDMRDRLLILKKPFDAIEVSQLATALTAKWQRTGELERSNAMLARKELEMRSVVEHMADAVITFDQSGQIRAANPMVETMFGHAHHDIVGANISMLVPSLGEPEVPAGATGAAAPAVHGTRELLGIRRDGAAIELEVSVNSYELERRQLRTAIVRDIRERLATMADLVRARYDAEQASRAKSEFVATMSHELRTPMNGVIGMLGVLERSPLTAEQLGMLGIARVSADSLMEIVEDILDFSKIEAGKVDIERRPFSVATLIEKACALVAGMAEAKGVKLVIAVDAAVPPSLWGDPLRLRQVLVNLLGNAIKFSSGSGASSQVRMGATVSAAATGSTVLELVVADNGIGMDAAAMARLFKPFSQADASTTRRFGGTGLGLAISRQLIDLMGGNIDVVSAAGVGSTFTVRLPIELAPSLAIATQPALLPSPVGAKEVKPRPAATTRPELILVAEDNMINQQVILAQLKLLGFRGEVVDNGLEALARWRQGGFALLLTDLQMPEMDGFGLAESVRREEGGQRRIPILALTANALCGESERCAAVGMDEYLTKPVQLANLQAALECWLGDGDTPARPRPRLPAAEPDATRQVGEESVDPDVLPRLVGSDPAVLREFFIEFAQNTAEVEAELRKAASGPRAKVGSAAHRLKGAARSVGALRLGDCCAATEAASQGTNDTAVASSLPLLYAEAASVRDWIRIHYAEA